MHILQHDHYLLVDNIDWSWIILNTITDFVDTDEFGCEFQRFLDEPNNVAMSMTRVK